MRALLNILLALVWLAPADGRAQAYPNRPVRMLVGYPPGGSVDATARVIDAFRRLGLPIYYSRRDDRSHPTRRGMWNLKLGNADTYLYNEGPRGDEWPPEYASRKEDEIVYKNKPSAFFGTNLEGFLRYDRVDTVVMIGVSTSGCVRQAAVDAFSHNFRVTVVEEACGDRCASAHRANLFDIDMKFGCVERIDDLIAELERRFATPAVRAVAA